jgi:hypothetical protein
MTAYKKVTIIYTLRMFAAVAEGQNLSKINLGKYYENGITSK